ncbi:unnamed protein product [Boreogadus saida]
MIRTGLSILVIFVCLAHTLDVETRDDYKKAMEAFGFYINSLKEDDFEMAVDSIIDEQIPLLDVTLEVLQYIGPEYVAAKKLFEAVKESIPELKAKWLPSTKDIKLFWKYFQKEIEGLKVFHETEDGRKKKKQAVKFDADSLKNFPENFNIQKDALAEKLKELDHRMDAASAMLERACGPKAAGKKRLLERLKERHTENKASFVQFDDRFKVIKKGLEEVNDRVHENEENKNEL